jgi:hypothetical protein
MSLPLRRRLGNRRLPPHHTLEAYLDAYIEAAGIRDGGKTPLFRSAVGRTDILTNKPMNRVDAWRMIQRRAAELGMRARIGCHTFRATGITAYLEAGGTLENAQAMAALGALTSFRRLERVTALPPIVEIQTGTLPDCDAALGRIFRSKGRAGGARKRATALPARDSRPERY